MKLIDYKPWLDDFNGIKPKIGQESFNNVLFSAEFLIALKELKSDQFKLVSADFTDHVKSLQDEHGGYSPKNSHDNLLALAVGLQAMDSVNPMQLGELLKGQHPRDKILIRHVVSPNILTWLLLPLALLDMYRALVSSGKVRPKFWDSFSIFMFRVKALFGVIKPYRSEDIFGGIADYYDYNGKSERIIKVQNDGKILNLLRLYGLKKYGILKPVIRFFKKQYIKRMGKDFQSVLFANYFEEYEHPVREVYRRLDDHGITILD